MCRFVNLILGLIISLMVVSCVKLDNNLEGWGKYVDADKDVIYHIGIDKEVRFNGDVSAYLSSENGGEDDFGTLMQACWAKEFSGHKVRLSAFVKTSEVTAWAGLWFRIDDVEGNTINFENMLDRPIKGTTDWKEYSILLDVPNNSARLLYGVLLYGTGNVWLDKVSIQKTELIKPDTTKVLEFNANIEGYKEPINLDFEKSGN